MLAEAELAEYLQEIREQVCSRCVERPKGGPPCGPLGKDCGVELHLANLIDAIREVRSPLLKPYLEHNRNEICDKCAFLHSSICPCPMDYLAALIVDAVETVDQRRDKGDLGRIFVPGTENRCRNWLTEISLAFEEARGTWTGCDWPTHFGKTGLNLQGLTVAHANVLAEETADTVVAEDWRSAARWLAYVEQHAREAETEAAAAVAATQAGYWHGALGHAERAWAFEFATGRPLWRDFPLTWQRLRRLVEEAVLAQQGKLPPRQPAEQQIQLLGV